jgi:50S ribosomal subunit-associated GTPase HflX
LKSHIPGEAEWRLKQLLLLVQWVAEAAARRVRETEKRREEKRREEKRERESVCVTEVVVVCYTRAGKGVGLYIRLLQ